MKGAAFLRIEKLKGGGIWLAAARHNKRAIQAELGANSHIDPTRTHLNIVLMGPKTSEEVAKQAKDRMCLTGATKNRKNGVLGIEIVFSLPKNHCLDMVIYFEACAQWAGQQFGGADNIISVDIHRDESHDHAHVLLVPLIEGRLKGSDAVGNKRKLTELQTLFFSQVASRFGFSKAQGRLAGQDKAQTVRGVLTHLRSDPVVRSAAWPVIRDSIERDPVPYALALGVEVERKAKPMKTMAQIFTSTGKGKPGFSEKSKPYMVSVPKKAETLGLCKESVFSPTSDTQPTQEIIRVRDDDQRPEHYDPMLGEFFDPCPKTLSARHKADTWVAEALQRRKET